MENLIKRPGDAVSSGTLGSIKKAEVKELTNEAPPLPNPEYKPKEEVVQWAFTPIGSIHPVSIECFPYVPDHEPPTGFDTLVVIEKAGLVEEELKNQLISTIHRSKDGLIRAAMILEKHVDYACPRQDCLIQIKRFKEFLEKKGVRFASEYRMVIPLIDIVWIHESDIKVVQNEPGVKIQNRPDISKQPLVESKIHWPEKLSDEVETEINRHFDAESTPPLPQATPKQGLNQPSGISTNKAPSLNLDSPTDKYTQKPKKRVSTIRKPG